MIVTKIKGGLGNQLFQWAAGRGLSLKHNTEYYCELSYFKKIKNSRDPLGLTNFKNVKVNPYLHNAELTKVNDTFNFQQIKDNSFLDGFWQTEKYFQEFKSTIKNDLSIDSVMLEYILQKYPSINENSIAIHVRRGNYVERANEFPPQTVEYYSAGYDTINESNANVYVLSNVIDWCKENIKFKNVHYVENETHFVDLYIMSLCKHNIIANSSFSWWGAWLNDNPNKIVVAPKNWFGPSQNLNTSDIRPPTWIQI